MTSIKGTNAKRFDPDIVDKLSALNLYNLK